MLVRELVEGQEIDQVLLVRDRSRGGERLHLKLGDRTGCVRATVAADAAVLLRAGRRRARDAAATRGGELERPRVRPVAEDEYDLAELLDGPPRSATGMEADLRELLATVQNPHLRALLDAVFGPSSPTWRAVPRRPGGQALPPGLPARAARALADGRPGRVARSRRPSRGSTATSP